LKTRLELELELELELKLEPEPEPEQGMLDGAGRGGIPSSSGT